MADPSWNSLGSLSCDSRGSARWAVPAASGLQGEVDGRRDQTSRQGHPEGRDQAGQGGGRQVRGRALHRPARHVAALQHPGERADRGPLRERHRLRRLLDPRVPEDLRERHAPLSGPGPLLHRPVLGSHDPGHRLRRQGPADEGALLARPASHRPEGGGLPGQVGCGRPLLLGTGARVLHLQLGPLRPELPRGLLPHRFR